MGPGRRNPSVLHLPLPGGCSFRRRCGGVAAGVFDSRFSDTRPRRYLLGVEVAGTGSLSRGAPLVATGNSI